MRLSNKIDYVILIGTEGNWCAILLKCRKKFRENCDKDHRRLSHALTWI